MSTKERSVTHGTFAVERHYPHLVLTEQGAFLDSVDGLEDRRSGTEGLLDELGEWLDTDAEGGVP